MAKRFEYICDGGSIMLGNETSRACFPNGYGDGCFTVEVFDEGENELGSNWRWLGTVEGTGENIYHYDCLRGESLTDKTEILYTLPEGRYGVYHNGGNIALELWN